MHESRALLKKLAEKLNDQKIDQSVMIGFDGYVDSLYRVIQKKSGVENHFFSNISSFSDHIKTLSGKSGQVELSLKEIKIGGNAPIMSQAMGAIGFQVHCMGTLGYPNIHPVFDDFHPNIQIHSLANPGQSDAFEFQDGKLIFSDCGSFDELNWEKVKRRVGVSKLKEIYLDSHLVAAVDWVNLPHASNIWTGLLEEIVKPNGPKDKKFFFDLCDPSRKSNHEIREALQIISSYTDFGEVTLGLNENETNIVFAALENARKKESSMEEKAKVIFDTMTISCLLIHPTNRSFAITQKGEVRVEGKLVEEPKILTGGGDNFNAGYALGWLLDLELEERLLLGMGCSGAYIQNGRSPNLSELGEYLESWL
ncbi:hypothetical protein [Pararhodonellum marinum]|uniref:hypothetical protein n=1 Tax=Pararhodonellum marinum TaxID=2755358 RepID=UPI0018901DC9|nr:hypothetical protein [Pararhodonellum marinum]